jgi:magnesium-transporting ATPase (P-type)
VGVGIRGLEGLQAFNVCDYGISQFRFLQYLVLVHGRWCYRRIGILVVYNFYKNVVVCMPQYFLGVVSCFSGQKLYHDLMYQAYNAFHSMLPIFLFGIVDQDVSKAESLDHPELYALGNQNEYLNLRMSVGWLLSGLWHSFVVFFVPYFTMSNGNVTNEDGKANDIYLIGTVVYLLVNIVVVLMVLIETCYFSWVIAVGVFFSLFTWFVEQGYLSGFFTGNVVTTELHGTTQRMFGSPMIYLVILTSLVCSLIVDVHLKGIRRAWFPTVLHKVQEKALQRKWGIVPSKAAAFDY